VALLLNQARLLSDYMILQYIQRPDILKVFLACVIVNQFNFHICLYIIIHRKVRLMKPTHDSLLLRVSCLRTHQTVFDEEGSCHLVYVRACEGLLLFAWLQWA